MGNKTNIVLLGMPGCGKSTVGVLLAKRLRKNFVDTDLLIQEQEGRLLCEIIEEEGVERFIEIENQVNQSLQAEQSVIAPGGSAVYGREAMAHFREIGEVVYLKLSYDSVARRLGNLAQRGVVIRPGQDLRALYEERCPLYETYADYVVECDGLDIGETLELIKEKIVTT
ncbi:MAG: shikimate kinase [Lachnospiraceae bacterium]|nr:shikimate kinase [Lachnospiraceae bacterium]MBP3609149.1 shikimate kinase [Lachnospiraceae bacterium]